MNPLYARQGVYVLFVPDDYYKIGISRNARSRCRDLQTGNPRLITVLAETAVINTEAREMERRIHNLLAPYRVYGEWFQASRETIEAAWNAVFFEIEATTDDVKPNVSASVEGHDLASDAAADVVADVSLPRLREAGVKADQWRHRDPDAYRAYMREYMKRKRADSKTAR